MNFLKYLLDLIASFFTDQDQSLGDLIFSAPKPWKVSCLTQTSFGLFVGIYNGDSRSNSKLFRDGLLIYEGREETIGQGMEFGGCVYFAGENGNLLIYSGGKITKGLSLQFASTCGMFNGKPYVFNTRDNKISAINCLTNVAEFTMPGGGIVTMALEDGGELYTAACDGAGGIACNDGSLIRMADCQCLIKYNDRIFISRGNKIYEKDGTDLSLIDELPCEKIMHMDVSSGLLWVTGSNPDSLWTYNQVLRRKEVGRFPDDITPVGGSVFRTRVTAGYWARAENGNAARVYKIK
ncbi:MAG: hypothetical protein WC455_25075 [Dehalococcoidia bacterium]|jgi:hypothetical protein